MLKDRDLLHYAFRFNRQQLKSGKVTAGCSNLTQSVTDNLGTGGVVGVVGVGRRGRVVRSVVYLTSPGCQTDVGLQLGKACYPCSR